MMGFDVWKHMRLCHCWQREYTGKQTDAGSFVSAFYLLSAAFLIISQ
jgi:hypothetical protein